MLLQHDHMFMDGLFTDAPGQRRPSIHGASRREVIFVEVSLPISRASAHPVTDPCAPKAPTRACVLDLKKTELVHRTCQHVDSHPCPR